MGIRLVPHSVRSGVLLVVQGFEISRLLFVLIKTVQAVTGPVTFVWSFKLPDSFVVSVRLECCIFLNVLSMTAGTQHLLMWDIIYLFFFFWVGGWVVPHSLTIRSKHFFTYAGLDVTEAMTEFGLMCLHLSVCQLRISQAFLIKHLWRLQLCPAQDVTPFTTCTKLYENVKNDYLNWVVQLRIKAVTCYPNQQPLGTTGYFRWYRYFSLPSFSNI
jgi:hypothetical protein